MSSVRLRGLIALVALVLPLAIGCGSATVSRPAGASVAPADATFFLAIDTSFDSAQWEAAKELVDRFPDGDRAVRWLLDELGAKGVDFDRDVRPALGPETDVVGIGGDRYVVLMKPDDPDKLRALVGKVDQPLATRVVDGWTVLSDQETDLDRFADAAGSGPLEDVEAFQEVMGQVAQDALLRLYVAPGALEGMSPTEVLPAAAAPTVGLSLAAVDGGLRVEGASQGGARELFSDNFEAELPSEVPRGALLYLDLNDLETTFSALRDLLAESAPDFDRDLARVEAELGVSLEEDVFPLFGGETALYVRPAFLIPEVTLVTRVEDESAAMTTVSKLVAGLGEYLPAAQHVQEVDIDGIKAKEVPINPPVSLFWAAFDGRLVVTSSREGIVQLRRPDERLADDPDFRRALESAGVPDETTGFAYVNLHAAIPYVLGLAGGNVPEAVRRNLEPLQQLVVFGSKDGETLRFAGFLAVD